MPDENVNDLNTRLRRLIETIDIANVLTEPLTMSINELLAVSADKLNSEAASVLVRDGEQGDLRFLSATGKVADQLLGMHVPAGKGIAGFVLMSGQPMAVSDVGEDSAFYAEVDRATGYSTQTILATPLRFLDEIIGVLEFINRRGEAPFEPFTSEDLDSAAIYADAIAPLVNAFESARLLRSLSSKVLTDSGESDLEAMRLWLAATRSSHEHRERMDLAILLREVAGRGEAERKLCRELLESIVRFSDEKNETSYLQY